MIAERLPQLATFTKEEKWQLVTELQDELLHGDPTEREPLKSQIVEALERSVDHYNAHPETGCSLEELTQRIQALKK